MYQMHSSLWYVHQSIYGWKTFLLNISTAWKFGHDKWKQRIWRFTEYKNWNRIGVFSRDGIVPFQSILLTEEFQKYGNHNASWPFYDYVSKGIFLVTHSLNFQRKITLSVDIFCWYNIFSSAILLCFQCLKVLWVRDLKKL